MPPVIRAIGYWATFFLGVTLQSISVGFAATGATLDDWPTWYKWAVAVLPTWSAAFGLTAATHWKNTGTQPERYPDYEPERVLAEAPVEELEDLDIAGTSVLDAPYQRGYTGQQHIVRDDDTLP